MATPVATAIESIRTNPMTNSPKLQVAVVQAAPTMFDTQRSLQKLSDLTADAVKSGARLVVFPEAFISGYPKGHDFGVSVGIRSAEGRDEFGRLYESAIDLPGEPRSSSATSSKSMAFIWSLA